jgi:sarcosine oxidase subunit alpha
MSGPGHRLATGGAIDRTRVLRFRFDGREFAGHPGDTLASALIANGVSVVGRGFKFHRPRGVFGAFAEEPNAIVQIGEGARATPNLKATQVLLQDGMVARAVNAWPNARFDLAAALGRLAPLMPAGFYYKTFMSPGWSTWEPMIRRMAGLGHAPDAPDPDRYAHRHAHCDVLVIGGGPAGIAAAFAASGGGARVMLLEARPRFGDSLRRDAETVDAMQAAAWIDSRCTALRATRDVTLLTRTTALGYYDDDHVVAVEAGGTDEIARETLWKIRAKRIVLATGAIEQPMLFEGNDRPGVMLASAVREYLALYGVACGRNVAIATTNDDGYRTALALHGAGIAVAAIIDSRREPSGALPKAARAAKLPIHAGSVVTRAYGTRGLWGAFVRDVEGSRPRAIDCDLLAVSGGWQPAVHLFAQSGGRTRFDTTIQAFAPAYSKQREESVGAARGQFELATCLADGDRAGRAAASACGVAARAVPLPVTTSMISAPIDECARAVASSNSRRTWIDLQADVTLADIELAAQEGYRSVEHLKRYTTAGMAIDQGKTSQLAAVSALAAMSARSMEDIGTTRFRPPFEPLTFGAAAGPRRDRLVRPLLRTPLDEAHRAAGAVLEEFGGWMRPACYPRGAETIAAAALREAGMVRREIGVFDGSTLGKIEVSGPDAAIFLDRMYVQTISTLPIGRVRYGVMLSEHGVIFDDGVVARLAADRFLCVTSSAGASRVAASFEEWLQGEWPELRVFATPVTQRWAVVTLAGPRAREILAALGTDLVLDNASFPHLAWRAGHVAGLAVRVMRVSFSGELSYEINLRWDEAAILWRRITELGVAPFGIEALMTLRTEKGFIHVGGDTDGTTLPADIGLDGVIARKIGDFVGRRSLARADGQRVDRRQLVGLATEDPQHVVEPGAHVLFGSEVASSGWVTSSAMSPTLGRSVALAMVSAGRSRLGETVTVYDDGKMQRARIVAPCFVDPAGERMRG